MNTPLIEGYTPHGFSRAFDMAQNKALDLICSLGYLDTDIGERPFCAAHVVFSTAVAMLTEMGWTPEELARDAADLSGDHLQQKIICATQK